MTLPQMTFMVNPQLISKMRQYANQISAEDVAISNPASKAETTEYKTTNTMVGGGKRGGVPRDSRMSLMELVIDFKLALNNGEYQEAAGYYFQLKRKLG